MVKRCVRCKVNESDVKLFDAVYEGRMEWICERCSIIENVPIIKSPTLNQLNQIEDKKAFERAQREARMNPKKRETFFVEDKLKELEQHPEMELPERQKLNLIENFHWYLMKTRRYKGLTQEQLAKAIGESPGIIAMVEKGKIPEKGEQVVRKLEQFFQMRLRKVSDIERLMKQQERKPVLLNEEGKILERIPEPEIEIEEEEDFEEPKSDIKIVKFEDLNIKKINPEAVTIGDLKTNQKRKIEVTKQEKKEEQKKVEQREKMIEARKEELRLMREKESKELDNMLGGTELLD